MGDSDDEFDRRRGRDKFRRERNDYDRSRERSRGEPWEDRGRDSGGWRGRDRRDNYESRGGYDNRRRDRYSPGRGGHDMSPPQKRVRRDWDEGGYGGQDGGGGGWGGGNQGDSFGAGQQRGNEPDYPTQPPMQSFKQFLNTQDDSITDEDALKKFSEYKLDFKKQQIVEFFEQHKEEEWFKSKYHPDEYGKRKDLTKAALEHRCNIFTKLLDMGKIDNVVGDLEKCNDLVKILDAAVILMEGGTDFDLEALDRPEPEPRPRTISENPAPERSVSQEDKSEMKITVDGAAKKEGENGTENGEITSEANTEGEKKKKKRYRSNKNNYDDDDEFSSSDSSGLTSDSDSDMEEKGKGEEPPPPGMEGQELSKKETEKKDEEKEKDEKLEEDEEGKPKSLHKTLSIFLRNLAPAITKVEVEALCKRYPGFMRVALQDPQPERRFYRRGWVTFKRNVNIKDICWNLNNIRLKECEMGAIVNRELKQRVRPVNGIVAHKQIAKADLKNAAKVIQFLDKKSGLWQTQQENKDSEISFGMMSNNPILKNITDYLVDEGSYEEEAYLGQSIDGSKKDEEGSNIERDEDLLKVLDRLVLYLRIVHSFDYYAAVEYPNEDEMPHRCGIIHARGPKPQGTVMEQEIQDWINAFENKVNTYCNQKNILSEEEAVKMGLKKEDDEIEKFIQTNTQELGPDKWLCPLSGKKFKGPDFIKKHIFNKHAEKLDEVKKEVEYFNTYLMDPKRPQLPEHPSVRGGPMPPPQPRNEGGYNNQGGGGYYNQGGGGGYHRGGYQGGRPPMWQNRGGYRGGYQGYNNYNNRGRGRRDFDNDRGYQPIRRDRSRPDPRGIVGYQDLDAPDDSDNIF